MPAHLIADETVTPTDPHRTAADPATDPRAASAAGPATGPAADPAAVAAWLTLSAEVTDQIPDIADREDLIVTIAPGAGHGSPACYLPPHATVEVDGTHLAIDPATAHPANPSDRARYPVAWGLLTHEAAHAAHSTWTPPAGTPPAVAEAAMLLEESRIEAAQIRRRPDDRYWLRASATGIILADTHADDPTAAPPMTPRAAGHAGGLILARVDAGILTDAETADLAATIRATLDGALGPGRLDTLRDLWQTAQRTGDDDTEAMLELGRRWCDTLGTDHNASSSADPHSAPAGSGPGTPGSADGATATPGTGSGSRSELAEAITAAMTKIREAVADETAPVPPPDPAAEAVAPAQAAEDAAAEAAAGAARRVFTARARGHGAGGRTAIAGTRPPTPVEVAAARRVAAALTTAGHRERVAATTTSATPPGRLRMRGALAADAQRAAGAVPTAEPFARTVRRPVPTPPLRLGIACDVSGSMRAFAGPVASAAWILARAAHLTPVPATTATVIFGHTVRPVTHPGTTPGRVTEFDASDMWENIPTAIDALDHALGLSRPDAARLLVMVSDGQYRPDPRRDGQQRIDRLIASGCGVLWLAPNGYIEPLTGVTVHRLTDHAATADAIARAATTALRATP